MSVQVWFCEECSTLGAVVYSEDKDVMSVSRMICDHHQESSPECEVALHSTRVINMDEITGIRKTQVLAKFGKKKMEKDLVRYREALEKIKSSRTTDEAVHMLPSVASDALTRAHEYRGNSWVCKSCDWINTFFRKTCRNLDCGERRPG